MFYLQIKGSDNIEYLQPKQSIWNTNTWNTILGEDYGSTSSNNYCFYKGKCT